MATRDTARLWLPATARASLEDQRYVCRLCKTKFARPDDLARHVAKHVRYEEAEIRMLSLRERAPGICGDEGVDLEFVQWSKRTG